MVKQDFRVAKLAILRCHACHLAEVNENVDLGYSQDQDYSEFQDEGLL